MVQGTGKHVRYRETFEIEKFEIEKGYSVFLGGGFQGTEHFVRDREIFEIEGSRDRESPLYFLKVILKFQLKTEQFEFSLKLPDIN